MTFYSPSLSGAKFSVWKRKTIQTKIFKKGIYDFFLTLKFLFYQSNSKQTLIIFKKIFLFVIKNFKFRPFIKKYSKRFLGDNSIFFGHNNFLYQTCESFKNDFFQRKRGRGWKIKISQSVRLIVIAYSAQKLLLDNVTLWRKDMGFLFFLPTLQKQLKLKFVAIMCLVCRYQKGGKVIWVDLRDHVIKKRPVQMADN